MSVSAKDLGTGKSQQVTITGGTALGKDDIDRMVKDAEAHANEDARRKEQAEARNQADHAAYTIEKQLKEHGDKVSDDERTAIEDKVTHVRKLLAEDTAADELRTATEQMFEAAQLLGQKIYESSQSQPEEEAAASGPAGDDVVEAEIVDEGDES